MHTKFLPRLTTLFTSVILGSIILYNLHPDGKIDEECSDLNLNFPIFLSAVHILGIKKNSKMKGQWSQIMLNKIGIFYFHLLDLKAIALNPICYALWSDL